MRRENNRACLVCGKKYTYCPSCAEDAYKPTWLALYCSENCKKIFMTVTDLHGDDLTIENAKNILDTCDMSAKANYPEHLIEDIEMIYTKYENGLGGEPVKIVSESKAKMANKTAKTINTETTKATK